MASVEQTVSLRRSLTLWLLGVTLLWPVWYLSVFGTPLTAWATALLPAAAARFSWDTTGGLYEVASVLATSVVGALVGLLGTYLLGWLRPPRPIWIPAAVVSVLIQLFIAQFWFGMSGSDTGMRNIIFSFASALVVGASVGIGAWLGTRSRRYDS